MAEHKFKVGDVVKLKTGGPPMTVVGFADSRVRASIECAWFVDGELKRGEFPEDALAHAAANSSKPPPTGYVDERGVYHPGGDE